MTDEEVEVVISFRGQDLRINIAESSDVNHLKDLICEQTGIPPQNQKLLGKCISIPNLLIKDMVGTRIMLVGSTTAEIDKVQSQKSRLPDRPRSRAIKPATRRVPTSQYTFGRIVPLTSFPDHELATTLLQHLKNDHGIQHVMDKYKLKVGELTELDPAQNTTHESKTLGLNQNYGERILLRLRTDDYDGFRDYNTIRRTLCHELSHNRHGEHDANFWDFYRVLDRECVQYSGGTKLGEEYLPPNEHDEGETDHGAFVGGTFTLGGGESDLSAREAILRAAERRSGV